MPRPSADEERKLARAIQAGNDALERLVELLAPWLKATLQATDTSPLSYQSLLQPALAGIRRAIENHALSGAPDCELVGSAAAMVQEAVADYIDGSEKRRWSCGGDGTRWASDRLPRKTFEETGAGSDVGDPDLWEAIKDRAAAIETLVRSHTRLLASMIAARRGRRQDDVDLLQRGRLALRRAAERFTTDGSPRFSSLARTVIANELENARRESSSSSANACRLIGEFQKEEMRLTRASDSLPSEGQVFESLRWSRTKRENFRKAVAANAGQIPAEGEPAQHHVASPLDELIEREDAKRFEATWAALDPLAQQVWIARFYAAKRETRQELAARLGLTVHRIRRLEDEVREKLRLLLD